MNVLHIDHLNFRVRDLSATEDFYRRVFGFKEVETGIYDGRPWTIVQSGDALLCLYQAPDGASLDGGGLNHFAFRIDDEDAWLDTIRREGLEVRYGGAVDWPHSRSWYVDDPSGYEIEVALWARGRPDFS